MASKVQPLAAVSREAWLGGFWRRLGRLKDRQILNDKAHDAVVAASLDLYKSPPAA